MMWAVEPFTTTLAFTLFLIACLFTKLSPRDDSPRTWREVRWRPSTCKNFRASTNRNPRTTAWMNWEHLFTSAVSFVSDRALNAISAVPSWNFHKRGRQVSKLNLWLIVSRDRPIVLSQVCTVMKQRAGKVGRISPQGGRLPCRFLYCRSPRSAAMAILSSSTRRDA